MPQYPWIETPQFEREVQRELQDALTIASFSGPAYALAGELGRIARENKLVLETREPERSRADALKSVREIALDAMITAKKAGRSAVTQADLTAAIQTRACLVWPFSK
jgi:histone H3/H4